MLGITNPGVATALRSLDGINTSLSRAVEQAATGKTVATAADSPAAYVNAIRLNSDAQAFMAVKSGLDAAEGPVKVAAAAIDGISNALMNLTSASIEAQAGGDFTAPIAARIQSLLSQAASFQSDATVNGVNLLAGGVVAGVKMTQMRVPTDLGGKTITIGDTGLSQMNASLPGLGLDNFTGTQDGLSIDFSSLSVENISTSQPPTQVQVRTANYGTGETPQYPGQSWTFVFTDLPASSTAEDSSSVTDADGDVTHVDHTIAVPLPSGFALQDAITRLRDALFTAQFETQFTAATQSSGPVLSIAGNNVGTVAAGVGNLRPSANPPLITRPGLRQRVVTATGATSIAISGLQPPPSGNMSDYVGAIYLQTQHDIDNYIAGPRDIAAFYLVPPNAAIPAGTTIASIGPISAGGAFSMGLSAATTAAIPLPPVATGSGANIVILLPRPEVPDVTATIWGGAAGAIATLNSALRKTGSMAQSLGNTVNSLRQMGEHAMRAVDNLHLGIGDMTDADMGKVSANMQSLRIRQQLATQSLSIAEQWPSLLLQLFK